MFIKKIILLSLLTNIFGFSIFAQGAKQEINILLLGKSSAGKSSLINIFYNHLKGHAYGDLRDVIVPYVHLDKVFPITVKEYDYGIVPNLEKESQTQGVYSYKVETEDLILTLWDTPGVPDTNPDKDKEHVADIQKTLANVPVHSIVIVLPEDTFDRASSEYLITMGNIVNSFPESYSRNVIGIVNRVVEGDLDDATKANYQTKLSAVFGIQDSTRRLSSYYFDGSSFFRKMPKGPEKWLADEKIISQIVKYVRNNSETDPKEAGKFYELRKELDDATKELCENLRDIYSLEASFSDQAEHADYLIRHMPHFNDVYTYTHTHTEFIWPNTEKGLKSRNNLIVIKLIGLLEKIRKLAIETDLKVINKKIKNEIQKVAVEKGDWMHMKTVKSVSIRHLNWRLKLEASFQGE